MVSTGTPSPCGICQQMASLWCPGMLLFSCHLKLSGSIPSSLSPTAIHSCSIFWPSVHNLHLLSYLNLPLFSCPPPLFLSSLSHNLLHLIISFPILHRTEASTLWPSILLSFMWSMSCIMDIPHSLPNIHL